MRLSRLSRETINKINSPSAISHPYESIYDPLQWPIVNGLKRHVFYKRLVIGNNTQVYVILYPLPKPDHIINKMSVLLNTLESNSTLFHSFLSRSHYRFYESVVNKKTNNFDA